MVQYNIAKGKNPAYMICISCPSASLEVISDLPEQTVLAMQSTWETRMPSALQAAMSLNGSSVTGVAPMSKEWSTRQMWADTSPLEFSFHLLFDAQDKGAYEDVFLPTMSIFQLVAPDAYSAYNDILLPPGPSRIDKKRNAVNLTIGKMIRIEDAIIVSAQPSYDNRMDAQGYPIACDLEVTIRTATTYSRQDVKSMMMSPSG